MIDYENIKSFGINLSDENLTLILRGGTFNQIFKDYDREPFKIMIRNSAHLITLKYEDYYDLRRYIDSPGVLKEILARIDK